MTSNTAASIRALLRNLAEREGIEFGAILVRYSLERILYRLSVSEYRNAFVLKGALLFDVWFDTPSRPTRDIDLLAFGSPELERITHVFHSICLIHDSDGITFDPSTIEVRRIRQAMGYAGVSITMLGDLDGAQIRTHIDMGFGDAVTPHVEEVAFPTLLANAKTPILHAYPKSTVIAEKLEAIVRFGRVNSRLKDYYDLWILMVVEPQSIGSISIGSISIESMAQAVTATFARRDSPIPPGIPPGLSPEFAQDPRVVSQWKAFISRNQLEAPELGIVVGAIRDVAVSVFLAARGR